MEEKTIIVINEDGSEVSMDILFTFDDDTFNKSYVLYVNPEDESGEVFVSSYTTEGELESITDEKEWAMIEEVFNAFVIKHEGEEHDHSNCDHDHSNEEVH
ncbi:DUF1292 domain-containing protein [Erysipelothrix sp. HDW6C]|uniref:DUF1292 domain-containing protein n=1 Tax=Erysipelothrix sp. HDW6C TaxID=2714930 RepID=UPI00140C4E95|nr:DUF1292 domain-containing protein [Erysipelothrix sp. HDW6C]QIK70454.1 DUF1292 domain-containing protein [Erysipelothrix sp. HDW6C]